MQTNIIRTPQSLLETKESNTETINIENFDIEKELKNADEAFPKIYTYHVLLRIFVADDSVFRKKDGSIAQGLIRANTSFNESIYQSNSGLILKLGADAFKGNFCKNEPIEELPKPGDWVALPNVLNEKRYYKGIPYIILEDHYVLKAKQNNNPHLYMK